MTTRAGLSGLLTGGVATMILYPLFLICPDVYLRSETVCASYPLWAVVIAAVILAMSGGLAAGWWSQAARPAHRAALGGLAGGLAGTIVFYLWGAAAAGLARWAAPLGSFAGGPVSQVGWIDAVIRQTMNIFLALFLGGIVSGAAGGWLSGLIRRGQKEEDGQPGPQMALNVSITAVPASIVAAALAGAIFSRLAALVQTGPAMTDAAIFDMPQDVSLLLVILSHVGLTMVIPFEARKVQHRCGMDEVKMAAYVSMGAAPVLIVLLWLVEGKSFSRPVVMAGALASAALSLVSTHTLLRLILPRRASLPAPETDWQKTEARWFGTIATSRAPQLAALCAGCGLVMLLPLYVSVLSVLTNLAGAMQPATAPDWGLFRIQALVSAGCITLPSLALTGIYLFYLKLGRWMRIKRNAR